MFRKVMMISMVFISLIMLVSGCEKKTLDESYNPVVSPESFVKGIDNLYFGLVPGNVYIYEGNTEDGIEHIEVYIMDETKMILGVECVVVRDTVWVNDEIVEDTFDWYAQDVYGDVWYFGEESREYENGKETSMTGSWEAGIDGAKPGILMKASPFAGDQYRQEYYYNEAEDMAKVISVSETVITALNQYEDVLKIEEWNPLEKDSNEFKYYAKGIGLILEHPTEETEEKIELIEVKRK